MNSLEIGRNVKKKGTAHLVKFKRVSTEVVTEADSHIFRSSPVYAMHISLSSMGLKSILFLPKSKS